MTYRLGRYSRGAILSILVSFLTVLGTFVAYRSLWHSSAPGVFVAWFALFEVAQFLLLADVGFSHDYLRRASRCRGTREHVDLAQLRGQLFAAGVFAAAILGSGAYCGWIAEGVPISAVVLLSLSTLLSLASYAETALLRFEERFGINYLINAISQVVFVAVVLFDFSDAVSVLALAVMLRSLSQFLLQVWATGLPYVVRFREMRAPSLDVLIYNGSYFSLFLLDGLILSKSGATIQDVAKALLVKKLFDVLRGVFEAAMQVVTIRVAKFGSAGIGMMYSLAVFVCFAIAASLTPYVLGLWVGDRVVSWTLVFSIAMAGFSAVHYRLETTRLFFEQSSRRLLCLASGALGSKILFTVALQSGVEIWVGYLLQGLIVFAVVHFAGGGNSAGSGNVGR